MAKTEWFKARITKEDMKKFIAIRKHEGLESLSETARFLIRDKYRHIFDRKAKDGK